MPFETDAIVDVKEHDDANWKLHTSLRYRGDEDEFEAPAGMLTDFASVPRFFVWLLPRYGRYTRAAVLHDHLWRVQPGGISLHDADGLFRRAMRELGVPFLRRWAMWAAVRWAAAFRGGFNKDWLKDFPAILVITLLMSTVVLAPLVVIIVAIVQFWLLEWIVAGILHIAKLIARPLNMEQPDKPVVAPELSLKL